MLDELPRLTHEERRLLCRRMIAIEAEQAEEIATVEYAAAEGFALLDRMEAELVMGASDMPNAKSEHESNGRLVMPADQD